VLLINLQRLRPIAAAAAAAAVSFVVSAERVIIEQQLHVNADHHVVNVRIV
jgi:hypothetical protein